MKKEPTLDEFTQDILQSRTFCKWLGVNFYAPKKSEILLIIEYYRTLKEKNDFGEFYDLFVK